MPTLKDFIIYEDMWIHGSKYKKAENSALLTGDGKLCCLGFCAHSLGVPLTELDEVAEPIDINDLDTYNTMRNYLIKGDDSYFHKDEILSLIAANDDIGFTMPARKAQIKMLFNKIGLNPIWKPTAPKAFRDNVNEVVSGIV